MEGQCLTDKYEATSTKMDVSELPSCRYHYMESQLQQQTWNCTQQNFSETYWNNAPQYVGKAEDAVEKSEPDCWYNTENMLVQPMHIYNEYYGYDAGRTMCGGGLETNTRDCVSSGYGLIGQWGGGQYGYNPQYFAR